MSGHDVEGENDLGGPAQLDAPLERGDGLGDVTPAKQGEPQAAVSKDAAVGIVNLQGDPDGFLAARDRLVELTELGETPGEPLADADPRVRERAKSLVERFIFEGLHSRSKEFHGPPILPPCLPLEPEDPVHTCVKQDVAEIYGDGAGPLANLYRPLRVAREPGAIAQGQEDPRQPALVTQRLHEDPGFVGMLNALRESASFEQRAAGVEMEVDGLLCALATFRHVPERIERILYGDH